MHCNLREIVVQVCGKSVRHRRIVKISLRPVWHWKWAISNRVESAKCLSPNRTECLCAACVRELRRWSSRCMRPNPVPSKIHDVTYHQSCTWVRCVRMYSLRNECCSQLRCPISRPSLGLHEPTQTWRPHDAAACSRLFCHRQWSRLHEDTAEFVWFYQNQFHLRWLKPIRWINLESWDHFRLSIEISKWYLMFAYGRN